MRTSTVLAVLAVALAGLACNSTTGVQNNFGAALAGIYEVPAVTSTGAANATFTVNGLTINYTLNITTAASSNYTASHIHSGAAGSNNPGTIRVTLCSSATTACPNPTGMVSGTFTATSGSMAMPGGDGLTYDAFVAQLRARGAYVNLHSVTNGGGEIRGQIQPTEQ